MAMQNNTTGASIYDLGKIVQSDSIAELNNTLKQSEAKQQEQKQAEMQQQQQMQEQQLQAQSEQAKMKLDADALENEKNRQRDILVAEIRAAGMGSMVDIDENKQNDFKDAMKEIRQTEQYREQSNLQREKESNENMRQAQKMSLEERKLQSQQDIANKQLEIARVNKNKFDKGSENKKKPK
jgi:hypothetical protein